jgi:hypothetical protein
MVEATGVAIEGVVGADRSTVGAGVEEIAGVELIVGVEVLTTVV